MSMPMRKFDPGSPMQQRVARLETHAQHVQAHISEIKIDLRGLNAKIDAVKDTVAALAVRMEQGLAHLGERFDRKLAWIIGLIVTLAAGCASGFVWLAGKIDQI